MNRHTSRRRYGFSPSRLTSFLCSLFLLFQSLAHAQDPPQYGTPFAGVPDPRDVNMYQAHIRPYSAAGNLAGVTARLDAIKALGTNVIYLMPIYPHGTDARSSASPYCIKDYKSVATEYGSLTDLRTLVDGAHSRGMAVLLDIAVNGTSWDHPWISQHPDWYVQSNGTIQQLGSFSDIAALNFANTSMRAALVDAMRYWILAANIDGYRCDYANNPPLDFWSNTITNLRGIAGHSLLMFAEGDRLTNFNAGFDFNFGDKWFYDVLQDISTGSPVSTLTTNTTNTEYTNATGSQQVVRYTANHDTEADEGGANYPNLPFKLFKTHQGVVANFLVCAYMRGVPFLTSGQEVDFNQPIPWPYTTVKIDWSANPGAAADFSKVLSFRTSSAAIRRGTMTNYSDNNVCAFTKINGTEKVIVMTNLRNNAVSFTIPSAFAGNYKDAYTGAAVTLTSGATQALSAYQYIVLTNANVATVPVTGVTVSPASVSISAQMTKQLTATIAPANATNQNVTWTSSNTGVATVNASGLVTAVAPGTATITVTTADGGKTATSTVTVTAAPNFTVHFYRPSSWGTTIRIYWWSAQPAGVLADGTWPGVTMTAEGNGYYSYTFYNITSTNLIFNDGTNQTADLTRDRNGWYLNGVWYDTNPGAPIAVTGVTVTPTSATVNAGATTQLTATVAPSNASNKNVSWSSSNTSVATVNANGLVTAVASGTAVITVTTADGGKTATSTITVPSAGAVYYQIQNRWQSTTYLYDAGNGQVKYGSNPSSTNNAYQWSVVNVAGGYVQLKNRATGNYMHVENQNGSVQCGAIDPTWYSSMWTLAAATDGWSYIQNRWQTSEWVHIEGQLGYAQYSNVQSGWYSAMWKLVAPGTGVAAARADEQPAVLTTDVLGKEGVALYPNPSRGHAFYVQVQGLEPSELATVRVRDGRGVVVLEKKTGRSSYITHSLPAGLYIVEIISKKLRVSKKLVVQ